MVYKHKEDIIQDKKILLYKPYTTSSSEPRRLLTPEPILSKKKSIWEIY